MTRFSAAGVTRFSPLQACPRDSVLSAAGVRAPFLRVGWNRQFVMMREFGFVYDSSITAPFSEIPFWPYTLDYRIPHKCVGQGVKCPSRSFSGIWEMVMNQLKVNVSALAPP